jgi:hypothetical protein
MAVVSLMPEGIDVASYQGFPNWAEVATEADFRLDEDHAGYRLRQSVLRAELAGHQGRWALSGELSLRHSRREHTGT